MYSKLFILFFILLIFTLKKFEYFSDYLFLSNHCNSITIKSECCSYSSNCKWTDDEINPCVHMSDTTRCDKCQDENCTI